MCESKEISIPDDLLLYLNEIAERLHSDHAAIMVGSGLSRSIKQNAYAESDFPDWSHLGDLFYEKLHNRKPGADSRYLSIPTLAHELEAAVGRSVLDQMLRNFIPDQDFEPTELHTKLLELHWKDVFTTNYDTLLERASESITSRKYDIVVTQKDLVFSEAPRIVKLHGSFPSTGHFIVTDEDYRTYPQNYAPLLNTVRQALLENTLCLIGFSGNDPNFLQWVGWVHDNLGRENSPKIYLVGLLELSKSQIKLLERRNIIPLDLSKHPGIKKGDHYMANGFFLDFLRSKREAFSQLQWPSEIPPSVYSRKENEANTGQVARLVSIWKDQRASYPGWVIVPEDRRSVLWMATREWIDYHPPENILSEDLKLEYAFELVWRTEKCLCPILDSQVEFLESVLDRVLPLDEEEVHGSEFADQHGSTGNRSIGGKTEYKRHYLILALMRYYREEGKLVKWDDLREQAQNCLLEMSFENVARFHYEQTLMALFQLNQPEFKKRIMEWRVDESLPFWAAKRGALMAEIGMAEEAGRILDESLAAIRKKSNLRPNTTDYSRVSQESFIMLLLHVLDWTLSLTRKEPLQFLESDEGFTERRHSLRQYKCDPWDELKGLSRAMERIPETVLNVTEKPTFDIGKRERTRHLGGGSYEALAALNYLRFHEDAGIPLGIMGSSEVATGTLSRISEVSPFWAMASLVRSGDKRVVNSLFNRESLSKMSPLSIDILVIHLIEAMKNAISDFEASRQSGGVDFVFQMAAVVPEILSRLCCKCSNESRDALFDFLLLLYRSEERRHYSGIRNLANRLFDSYSIQHRCELIPKLLEFPILSDLEGLEKTEFTNPFLLLYLERAWIPVRSTISNEKIDVWVKEGNSDNSSTRTWSLVTLCRLHDWGMLSPVQESHLADVLWNRIGKDGFPTEPDIPRHLFLSLPHPAEVDEIALFKTFVKQSQFPVHGNSTRFFTHKRIGSFLLVNPRGQSTHSMD